MRIYWLVLSLLLILPWSAKSQSGEISTEGREKLQHFEDTLSTLSVYMFAQDSQIIRYASLEQFIPKLVSALKVENSFNFLFGKLEGVSIIYPPDSSFRIFSWQLEVSKGDYRYYGVIQMNTPEIKIFPLIDRSFEMVDPELISSDPTRWYGCFYYNIREFKNRDGHPYYLLFGYDTHNYFNRKKIIDVLRISDHGAELGLPLFIHYGPDSTEILRKSRLILEFKADAHVNLEFLPDRNQIVFDHMTRIESGSQFVPDGTYEGYQYNNGDWIYLERVFNHTYDVAPRPNPILENRKGKSIFGENKKKN